MTGPRRNKFPAKVISPSTGAIVTGTDPCICGHAPEEHGHDPVYPGSTACQSDLGSDVPGDGCDCMVYEADPETT